MCDWLGILLQSSTFAMKVFTRQSFTLYRILINVTRLYCLHHQLELVVVFLFCLSAGLNADLRCVCAFG